MKKVRIDLMEIKSVMILAGGLGTRFKEYTEKYQNQ